MSAAFTPGPWRLRVVNRASGVPCGFNILYPEEAGKPDVAIASVYTHGGADARLIAAAPDMYEALGVCLAMAERALKSSMNLNGKSPYDIGMDALRKARGEQ